MLELKSCQHFENLAQIVRKVKASQRDKNKRKKIKNQPNDRQNAGSSALHMDATHCLNHGRYCGLFSDFFTFLDWPPKIFEIFCFRLAKFAAANGVLQRSGMQAREIHQRIIKFAVTYGVLLKSQTQSQSQSQECAVSTPKRNNACLPTYLPNYRIAKLSLPLEANEIQ